MLARYLLKEILSRFVTVFVIVNTVVFISQLLRLAEMLFRFGFSIENILMPVLFEVVSTAPVTIPTTLLFATMLAFERFTRDGELIAMLAAGYSLIRVLGIVLTSAALFYLLTLAAALYLDPWGRQELLNFSQRKAYEKVANIHQHLRAGVFWRDIPGYVLHVQRVSKAGTIYHNVLLAPQASDNFVLTAKQAQLEEDEITGNLHLVFVQGVIYRGDSVLQFTRWHLDLVRLVHQHLMGRKIGFDARRLYPAALWQHWQNKKTDVHTQLLLPRRLGRPLLALAFAMFGMLLGTRLLRRGRNFAPLYTVLTVLVCFSLGALCEYSAQRGLLSPTLAVWLPHTLLVAVALLLVMRKNQKPLGESLWRER